MTDEPEAKEVCSGCGVERSKHDPTLCYYTRGTQLTPEVVASFKSRVCSRCGALKGQPDAPCPFCDWKPAP